MNHGHSGQSRTIRRRRLHAAMGFTLIEALMALSLLSIISGMAYSFYLFANKQVLARERKAFEFDNAIAILESIGKNIRKSRATILLDETQWIFIKPGGDTASYFFSDTAVTYNRVPLTLGGMPIRGFSFTCSGNDSLLDMNGDQEVGFSELDRDGNGRIEGFEAQSIAWIKATLDLKADGEKTLEIVEEAKNNHLYDESGLETYFR
jgi:prepilin-type N-terminal cleavage/methylation domain-containing protein